MEFEDTIYAIEEEAVLNRHSILPFTQETDRSVLIVDDEDYIRRLFKIHICERYPCATAASVEEALWILEKTPFAVVLTDLLMPERSGIDLLREMKQKFPETVIVIVSGIDKTEAILDVVHLGIYDYLLKPVDLGALDSTIERALKHHTLLKYARLYKQISE